MVKSVYASREVMKADLMSLYSAKNAKKLFKIGDIVTPRSDTNVMGDGVPCIVHEVVPADPVMDPEGNLVHYYDMIVGMMCTNGPFSEIRYFYAESEYFKKWEEEE